MSETAWVLTLGTAALFILGVPIVFAIGIASLGALVLADVGIVILSQKMIQGSTIFSLLAVPCFILAGDIMQTGGLASRLINVARVMVRHLTGGLGMVTVLSATFFAALSGSSPATTAAIGSIMIPEMEKRGYRRDFSTALAASAGPLGQMIPPSIPMVIWGVISETSITALFFAGIVPGLLTSFGLMVVCYLVARSQGVLGDEHRASGRELLAAIADGKWALLTPLIILGGIYGGVFTPTEAGAVAVAYSLLIGVFVHREMKLSELPGILLKSMRTTAIAVFILTTALVLRIPDRVGRPAGQGDAGDVRGLRRPGGRAPDAQPAAADHRRLHGHDLGDGHPGDRADRHRQAARARSRPSGRDRRDQLWRSAFSRRHSASTCSSAPPSRGCGSRRSPGQSGRCCWSRFWCCWRSPTFRRSPSPFPGCWSDRTDAAVPGISYTPKVKRLPRLEATRRSGMRRRMESMKVAPVQCIGTTTSGASRSNSSTVCSI